MFTPSRMQVALGAVILAAAGFGASFAVTGFSSASATPATHAQVHGPGNPPPLPAWVNPDGTVNQSKLPKRIEIAGPNGQPVIGPSGRPITIPTGPPLLPPPSQLVKNNVPTHSSSSGAPSQVEHFSYWQHVVGNGVVIP